ncbi:MAG: EF2563 family selenium-dependent molybdenum hydroxylase system protein [Dehalococcoidia bacterium]|nr:EF2563 family selenium-dependent molybdenum hydroxylase system protein [Dehalococcoidia bacterium]
MSMELTHLVVLIRGGGEVASGVAHRLARAHFRVCMTETSRPLAVSRGVAFCEAIYEGEKEVEGVIARHVKSATEIREIWRENKLPIIIDPEASIRDALNPHVLVDAIMAKRNLGTKITDAPLVIGLGPGFQVGKDVHMVVETNNSERLGKVILQGEAEKDTGIPIAIGDLTFERVLHSPGDGLFLANKRIGDFVSAGEIVASVAEHPVKTEIGGVVRALLRNGIVVRKGTKLGEIDPSGNKEVCYTIRARVRAIAGGALEAILMRLNV